MFIGAEGGSGSGPAAVQSRARGRKPQLWRRPCCATRHVCQLGAHVVSLSLRSGPARACAEPAPLVPSFYITQRRSPTSLPVGLFFLYLVFFSLLSFSSCSTMSFRFLVVPLLYFPRLSLLFYTRTPRAKRISHATIYTYREYWNSLFFFGFLFLIFF